MAGARSAAEEANEEDAEGAFFDACDGTDSSQDSEEYCACDEQTPFQPPFRRSAPAGVLAASAPSRRNLSPRRWSDGAQLFRRASRHSTLPLPDRSQSMDDALGELGQMMETRRMRTSGVTRKSSMERLLLTARARVSAARDALDEDGRRDAARDLLCEAEATLSAAELQLGTERLSGGGSSGSRQRPGSFDASGANGNAMSPSMSLNLDTQRWLLDTFTDQDIEAATLHDQICQAEGSSPGRNTMSRHKSLIVQVKEDLAQMLDRQEVKDALARVSSFDFDAHEFAELIPNKPISVLAASLFQENSTIRRLQEEGCLSDSKAFRRRLMDFMERIDGLYRDNQYHNSIHACDVTATSAWFLRSRYLSEATTWLDHFLVVLASAVHDVGHPGTTNLFQSTTMTPLALRYNDKSILENMHVATVFELMHDNKSFDWFSLLCCEMANRSSFSLHNVQQYIRKGLIEMVLATDMTKHSKHVSDLIEFVSEEVAESDDSPEGNVQTRLEEMGKQKALDTKMFLLSTVLHAADISNPCKPHDIMMRWTKRVLTEFWLQGDQEREMGLEVSPLCDREAGMKSVPKGQLGFIKFVVQPFYAPLARLIPEVMEAVNCLEDNKKAWEKLDEEAAGFDDIFSSVPNCSPKKKLDGIPEGTSSQSLELGRPHRCEVYISPVSSSSSS